MPYHQICEGFSTYRHCTSPRRCTPRGLVLTDHCPTAPHGFESGNRTGLCITRRTQKMPSVQCRSPHSKHRGEHRIRESLGHCIVELCHCHRALTLTPDQHLWFECTPNVWPLTRKHANQKFFVLFCLVFFGSGASDHASRRGARAQRRRWSRSSQSSARRVPLDPP